MSQRSIFTKKYVKKMVDGSGRVFFVSSQRYDKAKLDYKRAKLELRSIAVIQEVLSC